MMNSLDRFINHIGWFGGEAVITIKLKSSFEGYYGKASESWETQYEIETNEITSTDNKILMPAIKMKSKRFEGLEDFCNRAHAEILRLKEVKP